MYVLNLRIFIVITEEMIFFFRQITDVIEEIFPKEEKVC